MPQQIKSPHLLALDLGDKRVGLALANSQTMLSRPFDTIANDTHLVSKLRALINEYNVTKIIAGIPRNLSGHDSPQTVKTRQFIKQLETELKVDVVTQDEALSSVVAEEQLKQRGKMFSKADIDKLAACLILEDYISQNR
ncbi:MAG: Holliday junction resolvase RuvX [Candidatus Saccharimonadales bacterium]